MAEPTNGNQVQPPERAQPDEDRAHRLAELYFKSPEWLLGLACNLCWIQAHPHCGMPHTSQQMTSRQRHFGSQSKTVQRAWIDTAQGVAFSVCMGLSGQLQLEDGPSGKLWTPDQTRGGQG